LHIGARQRAVALVAATPVYGLLAEKVLVLASLPPDDDDTRASLRAVQASIAKEARGSRSVWKSKFYVAFHRREACSMAWRCRFLTARPSQDGRVIAEK